MLGTMMIAALLCGGTAEEDARYEALVARRQAARAERLAEAELVRRDRMLAFYAFQADRAAVRREERRMRLAWRAPRPRPDYAIGALQQAAIAAAYRRQFSEPQGFPPQNYPLYLPGR